MPGTAIKQIVGKSIAIQSSVNTKYPHQKTPANERGRLNDRDRIDTARKALALDANNVDALNAMGAALRQHRRWLEAEKYFGRALAADPNSAELLEDYAEFLLLVGRTQ